MSTSMSLSKRVYLLSGKLDDPVFEGLSSDRGRFLRTVGPPWTTRSWKVGQLAEGWSAPRLKGPASKFNDFPVVDLSTPAFSERAVSALGDILKANGELLPVHSHFGIYYAFNLTTVADVLDRTKSQITWMRNGFIAIGIDRHEFMADKLSDLTIFRIPEKPFMTFVTQRFVNRVQEYHLKGFCFQLVWPLPLNVHWRRLGMEAT